MHGRPVGQVIGKVYRKEISGQKHFLRKPFAIALDLSALDAAEALGARFCEVYDCDVGKTYRASMAHVRAKGNASLRGHVIQWELVLSEWNTDENEHDPKYKDEPKQLSFGV